MRLLGIFLILTVALVAKASPATKSEIFLLGSLHNLHTQPNFNEQDFLELLNEIKPQIVLIEYPLDWFDHKGNPLPDTLKYLEDPNGKDGNRDAQLAWEYCKNHKVICLPFDIEKRNEFYRKNDVFKRLSKFESQLKKMSLLNPVDKVSLENINSLYENCLNQKANVVNGSVCLDITKFKDNLWWTLYTKYSVASDFEDPAFYELFKNHWNLRNKIMSATGKLKGDHF